MGFFANIVSSISGTVDKALICVKKPSVARVNTLAGGFLSADLLPMLGGATSNVDLRAKIVASQKSFFSSFTSVENVAGQNGYHVMKVKYNPSRIVLQSNGGHQMMAGPGGAGGNMQVQSTVPAMTTMQVELLFDDVNNQDAFMFEKFTNLSAGAVVSDVAGAVKNIFGDGYTVQRQIEGMLALITQSETRQVVFCWGDMAFAGNVVGIDAKYTMFNPEGHPIRGTVQLTIQESGQDSDASGEDYWNDAYEKLLEGGGLFDKIAGATGNLLNLK